MNTKRIIMAMLLFVFISHGLYGQKKLNGIGAGLVTVLPMGDFSDVANPGFGAIITSTYDQDWIGGIEAVFSIGYIRFGTKEIENRFFFNGVKSTYTMIPIMTGARYYLSGKESPMKYWVGGHLGFHFVSWDLGGISVLGTDSSSDNDYAIAAAGGATLKGIDLEAKFYLIGDYKYVLVGANYIMPWGKK